MTPTAATRRRAQPGGETVGRADAEQASGGEAVLAGLVQDDGFRSNLIGTPLRVAERILAVKRAGADPIPLGPYHVQDEMEYFGRHAIPPVRELEAAPPLAAEAE